MAPIRSGWDEESAASAGEDSPTSKKPRSDVRFPLSRWELAVAVAVFFTLVLGILSIVSTMPRDKYEKILRLPRNLSDLRVLKDNIAIYATDYQANFMLGYCSIYIFMQTFMIPGTIFMSLLAGALF
ncbi:hypothetical protein HPP92_027705 [Vanilla planifolia]|nr:hypothetical protein HPP92_027705 [Vanilla planifolia]